MTDTLDGLASSTEAEFVRQIRRNKEEIAAQIGPMLDGGHTLERLAVWVTDGSDRLGAAFRAQHPEYTEPMVAVMALSDMKDVADNIAAGMGKSFREPAPSGCVRVLSCCKGQAHAVFLRVFPENMAIV